MSVAWHVGVAENRRDDLAENELVARGLETHFARTWQRERTMEGKYKLTADLLMSPYFYVLFDGANDEQYALVLQQRGVSHVLEAAGKPGAVPEFLILDHRARERAERARILAPKTSGRADLERKKLYRVVKGDLFVGYQGILSDFGRGRAYLDCQGKTIDIPDTDIAMIQEPAKS